MTIKFSDDCAQFPEICTIEEAEPLRAWLETYTNGSIDLSSCKQLHTACLQILIAAKPPVATPPETNFGQWLLPLITQSKQFV